MIDRLGMWMKTCEIRTEGRTHRGHNMNQIYANNTTPQTSMLVAFMQHLVEDEITNRVTSLLPCHFRLGKYKLEGQCIACRRHLTSQAQKFMEQSLISHNSPEPPALSAVIRVRQ